MAYGDAPSHTERWYIVNTINKNICTHIQRIMNPKKDGIRLNQIRYDQIQLDWTKRQPHANMRTRHLVCDDNSSYPCWGGGEPYWEQYWWTFQNVWLKFPHHVDNALGTGQRGVDPQCEVEWDIMIVAGAEVEWELQATERTGSGREAQQAVGDVQIGREMPCDGLGAWCHGVL